MSRPKPGPQPRARRAIALTLALLGMGLAPQCYCGAAGPPRPALRPQHPADAAPGPSDAGR